MQYSWRGLGWSAGHSNRCDKSLVAAVHQETADELVGIERHHPVSLPTIETVILPLEGDAVVIDRDQAAVGDGDAMGVASEIAQDFCRSPRMGV